MPLYAQACNATFSARLDTKDFTRKGSVCMVCTRITYLTTTKAFLAVTDKRNLKSPIQINSKYVNAEALRQP